jgi:magnesium transporter
VMRAMCRWHDGRVETDLTAADLGTALEDPHSLLWLDFADEPIDTAEPILRETFGFHPLAIDDALRESHLAKIDDWNRYLYLALHAVTFNPAADDYIDTLELDIFLGDNYVVTYRRGPIESVDRVWRQFEQGERHVREAANQVVYRLTDELAASYMPVAEALDAALEDIEEEILGRPRPTTLAEVLRLKRAVHILRRTIAPEREVLNRLARDEYAVVDAQARVFFRDVYDHFVRLYDILEGMRDVAVGALDTYLSVINNRMNDIMKTLTIITTLFMPIAFLTSFFGMNFFQPVAPLRIWTSDWMFFLTLGAMVIIPAAMFMWLHRRGWM